MDEASEVAEQDAEQVEKEHSEDANADESKPETGSGRSSSSGSVEAKPDVEVGMDEARIQKYTASMTDIFNDVESPGPSKPDLTVIVDIEDVTLKKALTSIMQNFTETKVTAEMKKMYDLYQQSQVQNSILAGKCQKYIEKIDKYEARHRRDPRVMSALRMAEKHRNEKKVVSEEKRDLEAELVEAQLETRHLEDALRIRIKEMTKLQDELKKLRDIEKQAEVYETQLIRRENEIQNLQEKCQDDIEQLKEQATKDLNTALTKLAEETEAKLVAPAKESASQKFDHTMKLSLLKEIDTKQRHLNAMGKDRWMTKRILETIRFKAKQLNSRVRHLTMVLTKLRREKRSTDAEIANWHLRHTTVKNKLDVMQNQLQSANNQVVSLKTALRRVTGTNTSLNHRLQDTAQNLTTASSAYKQCATEVSKLDAEITKKEQELNGVVQTLDIKQNEYEYLHHRFNNLQRQKKEQGDLLRASQANTLVLVKEVTGLQQEIQAQERVNHELKEGSTRMRVKLGMLKNQYLEALDNSRLLSRQKQMQEFFAKEMEQRMIETETHMSAVVRANIQLYSENTTQGEIAVLQSNQFKIKEKETQALDTLNQDKDDIVERLQEKDRKKAMQIEQLTQDLMDSQNSIKEFKALIKTMNDEEEKMHIAAMKSETREKRNFNAMELLRRQRDLFGSRLLQARTELSLAEKKETVSKVVMKESAIAYRNLENDLTVLKLEIKNMRRKLKIYEGNDVIMESLRQDMASLTVALELEKAKCRALAESRQPIIHRWRALLAADPSKYELIIKIHKLTQRLIEKTTEVTDKELIIQQKDRYFLQLQTLLARRTVPSLSQEMSGAKSIIRRQQRQIKALTGELNMSMHDLSRQTQVIQSKQDETHEAKKKVIKQQRINRKLIDKLPPIHPTTTRERILGGGFYLLQQTQK